MAKKGFGKFMALATIAGAAAVGISYFKKYKSFNRELEEEFHDFEGDDKDFFDEDDEDSEDDFDSDGSPFSADDSDFDEDGLFGEDDSLSFGSEISDDEERNPRKYISLHADAYDVKLAAKDIFAAAGEMAGAAKNVLKDTAVILTDTALEAASAAKDAAQIARAKLGERAESYRGRQAARKESGPDTDAYDTDAPATAESETQDAPSPSETGEETPCAPETDKGAPEGKSAEIIIEAEDADGILKPDALAKEIQPEPIAGSAELDVENPDSTLETIKPEDARKAAADTEATTVVEEMD